uniref:Uncharacterized protein n=1 Tax=Molossus molossus TaxID=27622 RepID=A0A7J8ERR0_MOLMO|nr:hypothetical protein HJG59_008771 [Molossus molossus]
MHILCGTHPDPHQHRHTHLCTQYLLAACCLHSHPERLPPRCLRDLPQASALKYMLHTRPQHCTVNPHSPHPTSHLFRFPWSSQAHCTLPYIPSLHGTHPPLPDTHTYTPFQIHQHLSPRQAPDTHH